MHKLNLSKNMMFNIVNTYLTPKPFAKLCCSVFMEKFNIEVDEIKYLVQSNGDGSYSILSRGLEVLKLKLNVGSTHAFKWESEEGYKNELIDKFGLAIESYGL